MKFGEEKANSCSLPLIVIVKAPRAPAHMADHFLASPVALEETNRQGLGQQTRLVSGDQNENGRDPWPAGPKRLMGARPYARDIVKVTLECGGVTCPI